MAKALVAAAATATDVPATSGDALVGAAADVRARSGALSVFHRESTKALHAPPISSTEGNPPAVSVQANALEAF